MEKHERIQYAITQSGKQKQEIAELCHVTPSAISQWTAGPKLIRGENLLSLAKATGFRAEWLSRGIGPQKDQAQGEVIGLVTRLDTNESTSSGEVDLPYYEQIEIAADHGVNQAVKIADRVLRFSRETLKAAGVESSNAAVAVVKGRAMERLIQDGSAIGFDTSFKHIIDGEIYAFDHKGILLVKFLYKLPGGGIRIRSENSYEYPDQTMNREDFGHIKMLGRVFWWSSIRRAPCL